MIGDILVCFVLQIAFTVGMIILFGFLIALCNRLFYMNFGSYGRTVCYVTGAVGTPLHECAHALFCVIFGHKINEIKLFQINSADGTLGYVNHSYNPKNIYQKIGNFFIGVAPIIVISAVLYLLAYLLMPEFVAQINSGFQISDFVSNIGNVIENLFEVLRSFFSCARTWQWWVFITAGIFLALHMNLSKADIQGAAGGIVFLLVAVLAVDVVLALVSGSLLDRFTQGVLGIASYLLCFLSLALTISLIAVVISFMFRAVKKGK